jgi:hypothetical protein
MPCRAACAGTDAGPPWWRAAPASRPAIGREALDVPCRRARTVAGGAIGREALDTGAVESSK